MECYEDSFASAQLEQRDFCTMANYIIIPEGCERYYYYDRGEAETDLRDLKRMYPRVDFRIEEIRRTVTI